MLHHPFFAIRRLHLRVAATAALLGTAVLWASPGLAQPLPWHSDRPGPYALFAAGGSQYEYDCRSSYYYYDDCAYGRGTTGKVGFGWRFTRNIGVEGTYTEFGRSHIDNGRVPRDTLRMQALGASAVFSLAFGPATEGLLRVGLADVRHVRSDDIGAERIFTPTVGLAFLLHLTPTMGLEMGYDATSGEGRNTGTTVVGAFTVGLRLAF